MEKTTTNAPTEPPDPSPRAKRKERRKTLHLGSLSHLTVSGGSGGGKLASVEDLEDPLNRERGGSGGRTTGGGGSGVLTSGPASASRPGAPLTGSGPGSSGKSAAGGAADSDNNAKDTSSSKRLSRKLRKAPAGSGVAEGELILLRLEGRILEEKEREREKEKRRNELQQQQQPTKEDDEQQQQQHHQQLAIAAALSPKDLTRGGTLKRMMLAKAGGGSGVGSNLRDEMSGEKTTGSGICFNNNNINNNGTSAAANNSNNGSGGEGDAAPLERRQLNPLVLESQEDASASSLQKALSCVHEEDASLLPPLPMERLHRKSLGGWMEQLTRRASAAQSPSDAKGEELIEFEEAEIACLFWMQVELYRQACRFERDKAEKEARLSTSTTTDSGSSSPAPPERRTTTSGSSATSEAGDANRGGPVLGVAHRRTHPPAPVHKISSLGWPVTPSHGSYVISPPHQPILSSPELRLRIFQQHVAEGAPLRIDIKSSTVKDIAIEMDALSSASSTSSLSTSSYSTSTVTTLSSSSMSLTAQSPLSSFSFSPLPSPLPSPTSASASPFSADNLQAHPHPAHLHPHLPDLLFREAQRQVVFEEFRREYSKSEAPVSADAPDDHGWHFLEATKGFYPGKDIGCAKAVGVVFRLVMACSETRQEWDELYLSGKVTENLASNIQLLYFSMRSLCKTVRKRDFVVARAFAVLRGKEGERGGAPRDTFVVISKSVPSAAHPPQKEFVRGEEVIEGWIIKETGNNSSLITRVVSIDFRGKIPPSVVNALNHRLAITSVLNIKAVFDKVREKTKELMEPDRDTYFPFVARVMYPHQFITREETASEYSPSLTGGSGVDDGGGNPSASGASASGSSLSSLLTVSPSKPARRGVKISEDVDESDGGHKRECGRPTPRPSAEFPILSVMEGELVTVVKKVPGSKLWEGFHNRRRGLVNIDYIDPILPTLPSPSTNMIMNPGMVSLMEILLESDCRVVFTLLSVVDLAFNQSIPEAIIRIHEVGGAPTVLIKSAITLDLSKSTAVGTLFRGSEIHTSLLSSYAKTVAKKYLTKTLTSLIHNVCQLYDEGKSFEVDPARLKEGEVLADNAGQLVTTTRSFLEKILRTVDECPASLRDICRHLQREVSSKYPGTHYTVLGGLFFLRLLCPAIVSPTERALIKGQISPGVRRGLVMISKVLQNLANGIEFGCKEAHMAILNPFIIENLAVVHMFFDKLTDEAEVNKALKAEERMRDRQDVDTDLPQDSLNVMHAELSKHLDGIADKLEFEDTEAGMPTLERLLSVLTLLGPPSTEVNKSSTSALKGHLRRLSFGKGSFIKTFKQEREAQKEKEATVPKSIIVNNPDKSEPVLLPTIEEIMEERIEVVGNEDLDFSPEQRRRAKLKKDKLEKILGVALSPENLSAQLCGGSASTSAPPSARGDKNVLAIKDIRERARSTTAAPAGASPSGPADSKRRQSSTDRTTKRDADGARRSPRREDKGSDSDQRQQRSKHHQYTATVPGASHKQKLVHKRLKLQKLLGTHISSESMMNQISPSPSSTDPTASFGDDERSIIDDDSASTSSSPSSPSSIRKKWWLGGGSGAEAMMEGNDPPSPPRSGEEGSAGRRRHKTAPERPSGGGGGGGSGGGGGGGGGLNNFMRKWNTSDTAKERERKKSFIPWIGNNGTPPSGSDDEADPTGGGSMIEQQQPAEAKQQKRRKETFTGFFRRRLDSGGSSPETPVSAIATKAAEDIAE